MEELFNDVIILQYTNGCFMQITFFLGYGRAHIAGSPNVYDFNFMDNGDLILSEEVPGLIFGKAACLMGTPKEMKSIRFDAGDEMVIELVEEMVERELLGETIKQKP